MKHELERLRSLLEEGLADTENVPRPESSNAQYVLVDFTFSAA